MYTDADIEMAELAQAGNDIAKGICPTCTDWLDGFSHGTNLGWTAAVKHNKAVGPHSNVVEGYHDRCVTEPAI